MDEARRAVFGRDGERPKNHRYHHDDEARLVAAYPKQKSIGSEKLIRQVGTKVSLGYLSVLIQRNSRGSLILCFL